MQKPEVTALMRLCCLLLIQLSVSSAEPGLRSLPLGQPLLHLGGTDFQIQCSSGHVETDHVTGPYHLSLIHI